MSSAVEQKEANSGAEIAYPVLQPRQPAYNPEAVPDPLFDPEVLHTLDDPEGEEGEGGKGGEAGEDELIYIIGPESPMPGQAHVEMEAEAEVEAEAKVEEPQSEVKKQTKGKGRPSYVVPEAKQQSADQISQKLYNSFGLFKSKNKRHARFQEMVLTTTKQDRVAIRTAYHKKYSTLLSKTVKKNFSGVFRQLLLYSMMNNDELHINELEYALKFKSSEMLSTALCTMDLGTLVRVQQAFDALEHHKGKSLKKWAQGLSSNLIHTRNIHKVYTNLMGPKRAKQNSSGGLDAGKVEKDAKLLHKKLAKATKQSLDKNLLVKIFTLSSLEHISAVSSRFEELSGRPLDLRLQELFRSSSETGFAVGTLLKFATCPFKLYAEVLAHAIHRKDEDDYSSLIRFVFLHYDRDLATIVEHYGRSALENWIKLELFSKGHVEAASVLSTLCGLS